MLVVHWSLHNKTASILANGLRPSRRGEVKGVWCYPFSANKTLVRTWLRNLKTWDCLRGNCNGFVFRLEREDFPIWAGDWGVRVFARAEEMVVKSPEELDRLWTGFLSCKVAPDVGWRTWKDFELIVPRRISPHRIIRILKDREPKAKAVVNPEWRLDKN